MPAYHRKRWIVVLLAGVVSAVLVVGVFGWRYYAGAQNRTEINQGQEQLCLVLRGLVISADRGLASYDYYKHHPADLARAHAENMITLRKLDCKAIG